MTAYRGVMTHFGSSEGQCVYYGTRELILYFTHHLLQGLHLLTIDHSAYHKQQGWIEDCVNTWERLFDQRDFSVVISAKLAHVSHQPDDKSFKAEGTRYAYISCATKAQHVQVSVWQVCNHLSTLFPGCNTQAGRIHVYVLAGSNSNMNRALSNTLC